MISLGSNKKNASGDTTQDIQAVLSQWRIVRSDLKIPVRTSSGGWLLLLLTRRRPTPYQQSHKATSQVHSLAAFVVMCPFQKTAAHFLC